MADCQCMMITQIMCICRQTVIMHTTPGHPLGVNHPIKGINTHPATKCQFMVKRQQSLQCLEEAAQAVAWDACLTGMPWLAGNPDICRPLLLLVLPDGRVLLIYSRNNKFHNTSHTTLPPEASKHQELSIKDSAPNLTSPAHIIKHHQSITAPVCVHTANICCHNAST